MRADRLLSLLLLLQSRGRMTAGDLAERLEVSPRTIYRDLDALSAAGVPVYAERGASGGCVLRPGYRMDLTGLNESEAASIFVGAVGQVLDGVGLSSDLQSALVKIEAALPIPRRVSAERVRARIHVDAAAWFSAGGHSGQLAALRDALFDDRAVELTYVRADGTETQRRVEPLGLVVKGGIWYLVAAIPGDLRVYRVSRLREVVLTAERFERPARFDLATFWARWSKAFIAGIPEYRATLRVSAETVRLLPQVLGERVRTAVEAAAPCGGGDATVVLTFDSREAACGKLLGLGTSVEVLEPGELRDDMHATAQGVARLYAVESTAAGPAPKRRRRDRQGS